MPKPDDLRFKASAYLQRLIGRELFRNSDLAILELVKNAYDSGASRVEIKIEPKSDRAPGEITIRDDGSGMSLEKFRQTFMFAGFSSRPDEVNSATRIPTGEKGIGRFASDRLGEALAVVTKVSGEKKALQVDIDWTAFGDRKKEFHEVTVPYHYGTSQDLIDPEKGTTLRITRLRQLMTRSNALSLRRALGDLLNPYDRPQNFEIDLFIVGSLTLSGPVVQGPISHADLELRFKVDPVGNVSRRIKGSAHPSAHSGEWVQTGRVEPSLAGIDGRLLYFLKRPNREQSGGFEAGVRLYRDGFRIEPFGSASADWLGIAEKRAKRAGHAHIVPSRLFGFVSLSRILNPKLVDTTSREALIDTEAARSLISILRDQLAVLEEIIHSEIAEPRWEENRTRTMASLERGRLQTLGLMSTGLAHELRQPLQIIGLEVDNISTRLGHLGIRDAEILESQKQIEEGVARIDQNIQTIASLASGDVDTSSNVELSGLVKQVCSYVENRCKANLIELVIETPEEQRAYLNDKVVRMVLTNLLQNAIDAYAEVSDGRHRRITVTLDNYFHKHRLSVKDNASGIPEAKRPLLFEQFNTGKTGGMGLGLYLCDSMLTAILGEISFSTQEGVGTEFVVTVPDSE